MLSSLASAAVVVVVIIGAFIDGGDEENVAIVPWKQERRADDIVGGSGEARSRKRGQHSTHCGRAHEQGRVHSCVAIRAEGALQGLPFTAKLMMAQYMLLFISLFSFFFSVMVLPGNAKESVRHSQLCRIKSKLNTGRGEAPVQGQDPGVWRNAGDNDSSTRVGVLEKVVAHIGGERSRIVEILIHTHTHIYIYIYMCVCVCVTIVVVIVF